MKFSRKRKLPEARKTVCVVVSEETRNKLERMAGIESLGWTVEQLIEREWRRREKKLTQYVPDSANTVH